MERAITMENHTFVFDLGNGSLGNLSIEDLLVKELGPRKRDLPVMVLLLITYGIIFVSGTVGNVCTCIVIARNHYMQTTTNYYLFSLAISDLLILLLGLPQEAYLIWEAYPWRLGKAYCFVKAILCELISYASVLTITAFTMERYVAICHPLKAHKLANLSRSVKIIVVIWIVSFLCALPYPIHTDLFYYTYNKETKEPIVDSLQCNIPDRWRHRMSYVFQLSTFVFFVIPMTIITVLYVLIAITIRRSSLNRVMSDDSTHTSNPPHVPAQPRKVVLRMLIAVVVAFFVCWAPFHAQRLMTVYTHREDWSPLLLEIQSHLFYVSGVLYFVGSTCNPILYNVMSRRYRQAFKDTICVCFYGQKTPAYVGSSVSRKSFNWQTRTPPQNRHPRRRMSSDVDQSISEPANCACNEDHVAMELLCDGNGVNTKSVNNCKSKGNCGNLSSRNSHNAPPVIVNGEVNTHESRVTFRHLVDEHGVDVPLKDSEVSEGRRLLRKGSPAGSRV